MERCPGCAALYHQECWAELGGCATYGCPRMVEVKKPEDEAPTYWGTTEKTCPMCAEKIPISALVCPHCHTTFDDPRPMTREDLLPKSEDPALAGYRKGAAWLFILSLLGCTSPLALLIGGFWYWSHRREIARAGATSQALSLIGLGICLLYLVAVGFGLLLWNVRTAATRTDGPALKKQTIQNMPTPVGIPTKQSSSEAREAPMAKSAPNPRNPTSTASPAAGGTPNIFRSPPPPRPIKAARTPRETPAYVPPVSFPPFPGTPPTFAERVTWQELEAAKRLRRAEQLYQQEQFDEALEECNQGLKLVPGDVALRRLKKDITKRKRL